MFELQKASPIVQLVDPIFEEKQVSVYVKREDLIDKEISGNKWRKLKYNLIKARSQGHGRILTFGGAYSNHIAATAAATKKYGYESIGIIRGDELNPESNPTLRKAQQDGMELIFVSRSAYKHRDDPTWINELSKKHQAYYIPEGGSNQLALKGIAEMIEEVDMNFDYVVSPVGTGGTLAGIASALKNHQTVLGIAALNGKGYLEDNVRDLLADENLNNWQIHSQFTFGGYGKTDDTLLQFMIDFRERHGFSLDPIYTGKMMYGVLHLVQTDFFPVNSKILAIHTGGLQGVEGFNQLHGTHLQN